MRGQSRRFILVCTLLLTLLGSCTPKNSITPAPTEEPVLSTEAPTTPTVPATEPPLPTSQPTLTPSTFGPEKSDFPLNYNPLTGQPVADPSLLDIPALLVSISNFPVIARPQAGLSFAPLVFEFSITEGDTRFLATFYGAFPYPETPVTGRCEVRAGLVAQTATLLGNWVWLDSNRNGIQDPGELGIGGVCVNLYDSSGKLIDRTTTDSNGYYAFNIEAGQDYVVEFIKLAGMDFTTANVGNDDQDSDADPVSGKTAAITVNADSLRWDAGLYLNGAVPTATADLKNEIRPQVGPVRSGRLLYGYIGNFFQDSCLIYAFASKEVLAAIPKCSFVTHEYAGGGAMLDIARMEAIARDNAKHKQNFNYASNLFDSTPPKGGAPASQIDVFYALLNQSGWRYDPASQSYLRYTDNTEKSTAGQLHPDTDRLNGRQLKFDNVIVILANHEVISPTNLDIHLDQGEEENAYLFRNGKMYPIKWSTHSTEYEKKSGMRQPIRFIKKDGTPAALKPGNTWVTIVTTFSQVSDEDNGTWQVRYYAPEGEAR